MAVEMNIIFVGGTGRCGKSIVAEALARHPDAYKPPFELRFITDPDGLVDTYVTWKYCWTPYIADVKLGRLIGLLADVGFSFPDGDSRYKDWALSTLFSEWRIASVEMYEQLGKMVTLKWVGESCKGASFIHTRRDPELVRQAIGAFLHRLFTSLAQWKDVHTLILDETWAPMQGQYIKEMLPEAKIVWVWRDPIDTVASMIEQPWCPKDPVKAAQWVKDISESWPGYTDYGVAIENLLEPDTGFEAFSKLCAVCGLSASREMYGAFDAGKAHIGRGAELTQDQRNAIEAVLNGQA